jgi:GNAT superfamily N-acetyltransferase
MDTILRAGEESTALLRELAEQTWKVCYKDMISAEQIDYMLEMMYSRESLLKQMKEGIRFIIHYVNDEPTGFAGFGPKKDDPSVWRLEKLYVIPSLQKKGSGRFLLNGLEETAITERAYQIELNVNRRNPAVGFYKKTGFRISHEADIDIGNGFYMNDYIMLKDLRKRS